MRRQPLIVFDVAPAYERAEPEAAIADSDFPKPGQPPQIDQQAWGRQAEGENRYQALSPGDDERLGVRSEQVDRFAKGAGSLVIEGRGFHCYSLRGKTEPGAICTPSVRESAEGAAPNGRTSAADTQPRDPPCEKRRMRMPLPQHDSIRSRRCLDPRKTPNRRTELRFLPCGQWLSEPFENRWGKTEWRICGGGTDGSNPVPSRAESST